METSVRSSGNECAVRARDATFPSFRRDLFLRVSRAIEGSVGMGIQYLEEKLAFVPLIRNSSQWPSHPSESDSGRGWW